MLANKLLAQVYYGIAIKANSYHVNFHLRVHSRFSAFFTSSNAAPSLLAAQLACFKAALDAEDDFFKISTKSDLTPLIEEWDTKRDNNTSSLRAISQAYALNPGDAQKQADGQRILDLMKHYQLNLNDNYENQGSKTLQFTQAIDASTTFTNAIANIGATFFYNGIKEANEQVRTLIDQRNSDRAQASQEKMVNLRKRTDDEYRDLILITNAYSLTSPTDYRSLINVLNQDIYYYEKTVFAGKSDSSSSSSSANGSGGTSSGSGLTPDASDGTNTETPGTGGTGATLPTGGGSEVDYEDPSGSGTGSGTGTGGGSGSGNGNGGGLPPGGGSEVEYD